MAMLATAAANRRFALETISFSNQTVNLVLLFNCIHTDLSTCGAYARAGWLRLARLLSYN